MDFYSWGQLEHVWVLISCRAVMLWLLSLIKLYCFCLCKFSSDVCCSPHVIVQPFIFIFFNLKTFPFQGSRPARWARAAERAVKVWRVFTIQSLLTTWGASFGQRTVWTVMDQQLVLLSFQLKPLRLVILITPNPLNLFHCSGVQSNNLAGP